MKKKYKRSKGREKKIPYNIEKKNKSKGKTKKKRKKRKEKRRNVDVYIVIVWYIVLISNRFCWRESCSRLYFHIPI